jgi:E3 SUMO-protein ligase PIAS1
VCLTMYSRSFADREGGRYANYAAPAASSSYRPVPAAPAAGPSRNGWASQTTTTAYGARVPVLQDWKPNPMWKPIKALTNMEMLPGKSFLEGRWLMIDIGPNETSHTRKDRKVHMTLSPDLIEKLNYSK